MSDAAHLLSDLAGLLISLLAIIVARMPAVETMSFGFGRAKVLGAFLSLVLIWGLTIVLVVSAAVRLLNPTLVSGPLMFLLGSIGLIVNAILSFVLGHSHQCLGLAHQHGHGHGHAHEHGHAHGHAHELAHGHAQGHAHEHTHDHCHEHDHKHEHMHETVHEQGTYFWDWRRWIGNNIESLNVRAAYLHVLGDKLQSVAVMIAALVLTFYPGLSFVDPLCTLVFAGIILFTTKDLAVETIGVLMEGAPQDISVPAVVERLLAIPGVKSVGDFHLWTISSQHPALSAHLFVDCTVVNHHVVKQADRMLHEEFQILHSTMQINCLETSCSSDDTGSDSSLSSNSLLTGPVIANAMIDVD